MSVARVENIKIENMKKIIWIIIGLGISTGLLAQANAPWNTNNYKKLVMTPNSAYVKDDVKKSKPAVLPPIREADAVWSIMIWRIIDVREKMNQSFYYSQEASADDRRNLVNALLAGIKDNGLTAYDVNDDEFKNPISYEDIVKKLDAGEEKIQVRNRLTGELEEKVIESKGISTAEVLQYMLKEQWYFDRNTSTLQVRIIGICPIRVYEKEVNYAAGAFNNQDSQDNGSESTVSYDEPEFQEPKLRSKLFWVYYPEARPLLATTEVYNRQNNSQRMSYDDLLIKRYFSSFIAQSSNVYDNRAIADYANGLEQIIESERIKNEILRFENDLWEY